MQFDVNDALSKWADCFDRGDPLAMSALFTEDAIFIGGLGGLNLGRGGVQAYFSANVAGSGMRIIFRGIEVRPQNENMIIVAMIGAISTEGQEARDYRFLQTYVVTPDGWRIAGHHGSSMRS